MTGFTQLIRVANRLEFTAHDIRAQLDRTGRYEERLDREFPFMIRLFRFRFGQFTRGSTWHERLELFLPLDGGCCLRMGDRTVTLARSDLLVVDNLKLHQVLDQPGLETRVVVISFLPEFVCSLGSPSHDYAFLLPFYSRTKTTPLVLGAKSALAGPAFSALANLLAAYSRREPQRYREAGCKAFFLELLYYLARHFEAAKILKSEFHVQQAHSLRLKRLFDHISTHYAGRISMAQAASLANLSKPQFTRVFKRVAGMTFVNYVNHVRLSRAAQLLKESSLSIAEVAGAVGFADQGYFDRQFRKSFGQAPREFRARDSIVRKNEPAVLAAHSSTA